MLNEQISDLNTSYLIGFKAKELVLDGVDSLNSQILNLLNTDVGERIFEPEFGSYLQRYLFEPMTEITAFNIKLWIYKALSRWLPFINFVFDKTTVIANELERLYEVTIVYTVSDKEFSVDLSLETATTI